MSRISTVQQSYQAENDHDTMRRAEEIKHDPGRIKQVKLHHQLTKKRMAGLGRILGRCR